MKYILYGKRKINCGVIVEINKLNKNIQLDLEQGKPHINRERFNATLSMSLLQLFLRRAGQWQI